MHTACPVPTLQCITAPAMPRPIRPTRSKCCPKLYATARWLCNHAYLAGATINEKCQISAPPPLIMCLIQSVGCSGATLRFLSRSWSRSQVISEQTYLPYPHADGQSHKQNFEPGTARLASFGLIFTCTLWYWTKTRSLTSYSIENILQNESLSVCGWE